MRRRQFIALVGIAAATGPLAARAQQPAIPVVGFMSARSAEDSARVASAFRQGLANTGFIEGETVKIEYRWANGDYDKLPALAADLVNHKVAILVGVGGDVSAAAAAKATKTIPVVFGMGGDPVKAIEI
jgi:putative ABC transport system substrate-binding protein